MEEEKLRHLDEAIRHSMEVECNIRNTRTNWFLVFQAALGGGLIQLLFSNVAYCSRLGSIITMALIGSVISVSFAFAAWRSDKAIDMLFAYWDQIRCENGMKIKDYYPISPISKNIIYHFVMNSYDKNNDDSIWEHDIAKQMHIGRFDKWINKCDILMPYKFLPWMFLFCWIIVLVLVWIFREEVLHVDNIGSSLNIINCR